MSGASLLRKFGNLSIRKILVVTSAYARTDSGGVGGKSQDNPTGSGECQQIKPMPSFLGGKSRGAFGQPAFFLAGNRMTIVAFEKEVSLSLFSKTIVRRYCSFNLEKKHLIPINGKKKFKRILVVGENFKLRKLPSKDLIALFSSRPCSETQPE